MDTDATRSANPALPVVTEPAWGLVPGAALAPGLESTVLQSAPPIERAGTGRGGWTEPEEQL